MSYLTIFILCLCSFQYAASQLRVAVIIDRSSGLILDAPSRGSVRTIQRNTPTFSRFWDIIDNEDKTFYVRNIRRGTNLAVTNCVEGANVTAVGTGGFQLWTLDEASGNFSPSCNTSLALFVPKDNSNNVILGNTFSNETRTPFAIAYPSMNNGK